MLSALPVFSQELNFKHGTQLIERDLPIHVNTVFVYPSVHASIPPSVNSLTAHDMSCVMGKSFCFAFLKKECADQLY